MRLNDGLSTGKIPNGRHYPFPVPPTRSRPNTPYRVFEDSLRAGESPQPFVSMSYNRIAVFTSLPTMGTLL